MKSLLLVIVILFIATGCAPKGDKRVQADSEGNIVLPVSDFSDGKAHYYTIHIDGKKVRFFLVKAQDGNIRAAFNTCDVCYRAGTEYIQEGNMMVCVNCGQKFPLDRINIVTGGCNPIALDREQDGETIVITLSSLTQGTRYFL